MLYGVKTVRRQACKTATNFALQLQESTFGLLGDCYSYTYTPKPGSLKLEMDIINLLPTVPLMISIDDHRV